MAHGQPMAKYWMHNGLMQASDEVGKVGGRQPRGPPTGDMEAQQAGKISKSKGSAPFRELLAEFPAETIRFFLLATHYRRPIDYSQQRLRETQTAVENFYRFFKRYERVTGESFYAIRPPAPARSRATSIPAGDRAAGPTWPGSASGSSRRWTTTSTRAGPSATCSSWCGG